MKSSKFLLSAFVNFHTSISSREYAMIKKLILCSVLCFSLTGCLSAGYHRDAVRDDTGDRLSIAKVQREIHQGMSSADVVSILGSPNMVSTDNERREVWVYDKVATERVYSTSNGGLGLLLGGGGGGSDGGGFGGIGGNYSRGSGAVSSNQRTITIIIKFDKAGRVRDYSYRQSSF